MDEVIRKAPAVVWVHGPLAAASCRTGASLWERGQVQSARAPAPIPGTSSHASSARSYVLTLLISCFGVLPAPTPVSLSRRAILSPWSHSQRAGRVPERRARSQGRRRLTRCYFLPTELAGALDGAGPPALPRSGQLCGALVWGAHTHTLLPSW